MPDIDLTITISVIVALCAVISPIFTALINNRHQLKMKRQEYKHLDDVEQKKHEREIYEGYIRAAGACVQVPSADALTLFGEHSGLAMYYVPEDIRSDMLSLEKMIRHDSKDEKIDLLAKITLKLRNMQRTQ